MRKLSAKNQGERKKPDSETFRHRQVDKLKKDLSPFIRLTSTGGGSGGELGKAGQFQKNKSTDG